jgi:hypothetical protein
VSAGKREPAVDESRASPRYGLVALVTVLCPALRRVIRAPGARQVLLVTCFTTNRSAAEVADLSAWMTAKARHRGVNANQGEPGPVVQNDLAFGNPVAFVVTLAALCAELASVHIFMTSCAPSSGKDDDWAAIVVTAQTLCVLMGA